MNFWGLNGWMALCLRGVGGRLAGWSEGQRRSSRISTRTFASRNRLRSGAGSYGGLRSLALWCEGSRAVWRSLVLALSAWQFQFLVWPRGLL